MHRLVGNVLWHKLRRCYCLRQLHVKVHSNQADLLAHVGDLLRRPEMCLSKRDMFLAAIGLGHPQLIAQYLLQVAWLCLPG